jgi:hypothetical protein
MQHPVMRPAEAEILENRVGVTGEVAIGEKQELGEFQQLGLGRAAALARRPAIAARLGPRRPLLRRLFARQQPVI